ncbi:MAG: N-glycosylase/DNA lyase, partial [Methanoculleus sp.]|nr:N-glycosylase/DNA lyase [Methanoculleus sp.]
MTTITLGPDQPFDLDRTLSCGQAFRWEKAEGGWQGVADGRAVRIRQDENRLTFEGVDEGFVRGYFRLDQDLPAILSSIDRDPAIGAAIRECRGLRLVRQQPWECLASYLCATNTNIPAVKRRVALMAERYGRPVDGPFGRTYAFPEPEALAAVSCADL